MTFAASKFAKFLPTATFAMAVEYLMGLSDSVICGQIIGEDGLSVINLMQPVFNVVSFIALLVGTGTSVLYAMEMGRFDRRRASELLTQGLWSALGFGLLLGDGDIEFLLKFHNQLHGVERIGAKVLSKRCLLGYFAFTNTQFVNDNRFYSFSNFRHNIKF